MPHILVENTGDIREILQVATFPIDAPIGYISIDIGSQWDDYSKNTHYWNNITQQVVAYTPAELLQRYKDKILDESQIMALEITSFYNYKIHYFDYLEALGTTLTVDQVTERNDYLNKYTVGVNWLSNRSSNIRNSTTTTGVTDQYVLILNKYNARKEIVI